MCRLSPTGRAWVLASAVLAASIAPATMARAQNAGEKPGSLVEKYDDWLVECSAAAEASDRTCRMAQRIHNSETRKPILAIFIRSDKETPTPSLTLIGPLGISLPEGVSVSIAEKTVANAGFITCRPVGCIARQNMTDAMVNAFRAGSKATVAFGTMNGKRIPIPVSLKGFSAAWARLSSLRGG